MDRDRRGAACCMRQLFHGAGHATGTDCASGQPICHRPGGYFERLCLESSGADRADSGAPRWTDLDAAGREHGGRGQDAVAARARPRAEADRVRAIADCQRHRHDAAQHVQPGESHRPGGEAPGAFLPRGHEGHGRDPRGRRTEPIRRRQSRQDRAHRGRQGEGDPRAARGPLQQGRSEPEPGAEAGRCASWYPQSRF